MKNVKNNERQLAQNVVAEGLDGRITLRLPGPLLDWVRQQGGSSYVRDLLLEQRDGGTDRQKLQQSPPPSADPEDLATVRSIASLRAQREILTSERGLLATDQELLDDQERLLDQRETRLEKSGN